MSRVFVDTWAWYALADKADADHELAQLTNDELLDAGHTFVTTNFVFDETLTLIRYNLHHAAAVKF
jgi:predicted nucleic acid-binding protein